MNKGGIMNLTKKYLSASQIKMWVKCTMQYFLKYVEGVKGYEEKSEVMELGSAIHAGLEKEFYGKDRYEEFTKEAIVRDIPHLISSGIAMLKETRGVSKNTHSVEEELWIIIDRLTRKASLTTKEYITGCDEIRFKGYIDRIDITKDEVEIADYKTGKFEYCKEPIKENLQLGLYAIYASLKYPSKKIRTTIQRLSLDFNDEITDIYSEEDIQKTINRIIDIVDKMEASEPAVDMTRKACKWCTVKSACPRFKDGHYKTAREEKMLSFIDRVTAE
jgi:CRISPR/Cas system-associated exonuclease Cas4 (RecB family)